MAETAYIYDVLRTPRGKNRGGALHATKPVDLVVGLLDELVPRNPGLDLERIERRAGGIPLAREESP